MAELILTVFREDDETVLFEVGTAAGHQNPYLQRPTESVEAEVDLLNGKSAIGQVNLRIVDVQNGATQMERWLTSLLAVPAGKPGAGHSQLNGRRAVLREDSGVLVLDGVVQGVTLSDSFAGYQLILQDIRSRQRNTSAFVQAGTSTVMPRGVLHGYGRLPNGQLLVPPTKPLRGRVSSGDAYNAVIDLTGAWLKRNEIAPADLVLTGSMRKALEPTPPLSGSAEWWVDASAPGGWWRFANVKVLWRLVGATTWSEVYPNERIGNLDVWGAGNVDETPRLVATRKARVGTKDGPEADAVTHIVLTRFGVQGSVSELPPPGVDVECLVQYVGPPTEDYPLHYEGTAGQLLLDVYRGVFSPRAADGSLAPLGVRYDEAALLALDTPVRLRLDSPLRGGRAVIDWTEKLYRALGGAAALDRQGRISPVLAVLPPLGTPLLEINDNNSSPIPGWEHPASGAITAVSITYARDYLVPSDNDPLGERSAGDGIANREITVERRAPDWARRLMGEEVHEIDGTFFRALAGVDGEPVTGDVVDETGHQVVLRRANETLDRWLFGGQVSFCRVRAAEFEGLREGDWVLDARSWRPNYQTGKRGGNSLSQVVSVKAANPAWLDLRLVEAGPADQPINQPTLGAISASDAGVVSIAVTSVPAHGEAAVEYAVADDAPGVASNAWVFAGRLAAPGSLDTPPQPAGVRVWVRARGEGLGRRPSAWTNANSVVTPAAPRIRDLRIVINEDSRVVVTWSPNTFAHGLKLRYALHAPDAEPSQWTPLQLPATGSGIELPGVTVAAGQAITVEVVPTSNWDGSKATGTEGVPVRRTEARAAAPAAALSSRIRIVDITTTEVAVAVDVIADGATPSGAEVQLAGVLRTERLSGPPEGAWSPSGTEWRFRRPEFGAGAAQAHFQARAPDYQVGEGSVAVEAQSRDTVALAVRAEVRSSNESQLIVRVAVADPHPASSILVWYTAQGVASVAPPVTQTIPVSSVRPDLDQTGYVEFTITRAASGGAVGRVTFTASSVGRAPGSDAVDVQARLAATDVGASPAGHNHDDRYPLGGGYVVGQNLRRADGPTFAGLYSDDVREDTVRDGERRPYASIVVSTTPPTSARDGTLWIVPGEPGGGGGLPPGGVSWSDLIPATIPAFASRWPTWGEVTGKPSTFAPSAHRHAWGDLDGVPVYATRWATLAEIGAAASARKITASTGLTGGGDLTADRTLALAGQALALHNLATNGLIARTASGAVAARTITGTTNRITVTNGDGVSGNPTLTLPQDIHTGATPSFAGLWSDGLAEAVVRDGERRPYASIVVSQAAPTSARDGTLWIVPGEPGGSGGLPPGGVSWSDLVANTIPAFASRWPTWGEVTGKPSIFAPSPHRHAWGDLDGVPAYASRWPTLAEIGAAAAVHTHDEIVAKAHYAYAASATPRSLPQGLATWHVGGQPSEGGYPMQYGKLLHMGSYTSSQDGGAFQLLSPYASSGAGYNNGRPMYRTGSYNNAGWSAWKTLADTDWVTTGFSPLGHKHSASDIDSGTLLDLRLSANVPLLNKSNVFQGPQTIIGGISDGWSGTSTTRLFTGRSLARYTNAATQTGAIVVRTGLSGSAMTLVRIVGYLYGNVSGVGGSIDATVICYADGASVTAVTHSGSIRPQVRVARNASGQRVFILGDEASTWSTPKIWVESAIAGHSGAVPGSEEGWAITVETDLTPYTSVLAASDVSPWANASNLASGTVPLARIPTGTTASTVALGNHNHDTAYVKGNYTANQNLRTTDQVQFARLGIGGATAYALEVGGRWAIDPSSASPNAWHMRLGDGTGWKGHISKLTNGTLSPLVTFTDQGSVGIGTQNPGAELHVAGWAKIESGVTNSYGHQLAPIVVQQGSFTPVPAANGTLFVVI